MNETRGRSLLLTPVSHQLSTSFPCPSSLIPFSLWGHIHLLIFIFISYSSSAHRCCHTLWARASSPRPSLHTFIFVQASVIFWMFSCSLPCKHLGTGFQQGICTSWLFHYFALLLCKLSRFAGMETKRRKIKTGETGIHSIWMFSREQGVNAGLSPHTGVMSQGQTDAVKERIQETFPH